MTGVVAVALPALYFLLLLILCEASARRWGLEPELARKLAHVIGGVSVAFLPWLVSMRAVQVMSALFIPFFYLTRRRGLFPAINGVERATHGELYFPAGVLLAALAFPSRTPYAFGVLVMGLGDALANLTGRRFGRHSYRSWSGRKTFVGSGALLLTAFALALSAGAEPVPALGIAAALTVLEGVTGAGLDNVVLPIAGAALLSLSG